MYSTNTVCDYVILKVTEGGAQLNSLKLQKLLYYIQAWGLALAKKRLINTQFEAWVHGPVSRNAYARFMPEKSLYSQVDVSDISAEFNADEISAEDKILIDKVLEVYVPFSGSQLEEMTHQESPWISARNGLPSSARSEQVIDEELMGAYYRTRATS